MGYDAHTTSKSNDGGYDVVAKNGKETLVIECKCYAEGNLIGRPVIQKLVGANGVAKADRTVFITTSRFAQTAVKYAEKMNVELIDGETLAWMINKYMPKNEENSKVEPQLQSWLLDLQDILAKCPPDYRFQY